MIVVPSAVSDELTSRILKPVSFVPPPQNSPPPFQYIARSTTIGTPLSDSTRTPKRSPPGAGPRP